MSCRAFLFDHDVSHILEDSAVIDLSSLKPLFLLVFSTLYIPSATLQMLDTRDWCDVDSDEEFCIPELPPLPTIQFTIPVKDHSAVKEEQSSRLTMISPVNPQRFRFSKESSPKSKSDKADVYVCFVGKLPNQTSIADIRSFVKSKGISFTEVRMGPKKRPNANAFGYVDLPTRKDYGKLLALDGTQYRGRAIRVDHATRKESTKVSRPKKFPRRDVYTPMPGVSPRQTKLYDRRSQGLKKADIYTKKASTRFQRIKTLRSQKTGTRSKQKYRKESKSSAPALKSKRFVEAFGRK